MTHDLSALETLARKWQWDDQRHGTCCHAHCSTELLTAIAQLKQGKPDAPELESKLRSKTFISDAMAGTYEFFTEEQIRWLMETFGNVKYQPSAPTQAQAPQADTKEMVAWVEDYLVKSCDLFRKDAEAIVAEFRRRNWPTEAGKRE